LALSRMKKKSLSHIHPLRMLIPPPVKGRRGVSVFRFFWSAKRGRYETATG
jgi:hypothetical protein